MCANSVIVNNSPVGTEIIESNGRSQGLGYSDIAIFFRSVKYDAKLYLNALKEAGFPYSVSGIGGLFDSGYLKKKCC
ncbi:MAG: hypothetical protein N2257_10250 [Thermodesulfovibrionales bacterium]|nr:hypothetical protein [Thermodesulfovibrionales bacterium]